MKTKIAPTPDQVFRALADPTRLRILNLLCGGQLCVCNVVDALRMPQPKVSRHLAYLRKAGLVVAEREGLWIHYRLAPAADEFHERLLDCLGSCFLGSSTMSNDLKRVDRPECS